MFIKELMEIIMQGLFLIILAYIGHFMFKGKDNNTKYPKIVSLLLNILK